MPECPLLAISELFEVALITSALPLNADVAAVGRESPKLTHNGHSRGFESNGCLRPETVIHWGHAQPPLADRKAAVRTTLCTRPDLAQSRYEGGFREDAGSPVRGWSWMSDSKRPNLSAQMVAS